MVTVKFKRVFPASLISHVDMVRTTDRILRRAGFEVGHSQGFNPHALLFFSPPIPMGCESKCEFVTVDMPVCADFLKRFNAACPLGIEAIEVFEVAKNPNLAHIVTAAEYEIKCDAFKEIDAEKILQSDKFEIEFKDKENVTVKDYRSFVLDIKQNGGTVTAVLKFGNENLRADRFVNGVLQFFKKDEQDAQIMKKRVFDKTGTEIDKILGQKLTINQETIV